jgi:RHH-type proline utilization regulon transcriptional repressor/proline dehydrogenase/delta 1-pyrroline-5-carboxylate dehydrogenase
MRVRDSALGETLVYASTVIDSASVERVLAGAAAAAPAWSQLSGAQRAAHLRRAAVELERRRGELIEVMAAECDKTFDQADTEVSEAVDMANYYAQLAEELDLIDGAAPVSVGLTLVTPPWNFPVAITAGTTIGPRHRPSAAARSSRRRSGPQGFRTMCSPWSTSRRANSDVSWLPIHASAASS